MTGGTITPAPGFSPALDADFVGTGNDYIHMDPDNGRMRLDAHGVVKYVAGMYIIYMADLADGWIGRKMMQYVLPTSRLRYDLANIYIFFFLFVSADLPQLQRHRNPHAGSAEHLFRKSGRSDDGVGGCLYENPPSSFASHLLGRFTN